MKLQLQTLAQNIAIKYLGNADDVQSMKERLEASKTNFKTEVNNLLLTRTKISALTINDYLETVSVESNNLDVADCYLPTFNPYQKGTSEYRESFHILRDAVRHSTRKQRIVWILSFLVHYEDFLNNSVTEGQAYSLVGLNSDFHSLLNSVGLESIVKFVIEDVVKLGKRTDPSYSQDKLLACSTNNVFNVVINNFRHIHTNYNHYDFIVDRSQMDKDQMGKFSLGLQEIIDELILKQIGGEDVLREVIKGLKRETIRNLKPVLKTENATLPKPKLKAKA